jgi:hypothetical protein
VYCFLSRLIQTLHGSCRRAAQHPGPGVGQWLHQCGCGDEHGALSLVELHLSRSVFRPELFDFLTTSDGQGVIVPQKIQFILQWCVGVGACYSQSVIIHLLKYTNQPTNLPSLFCFVRQTFGLILLISVNHRINKTLKTKFITGEFGTKYEWDMLVAPPCQRPFNTFPDWGFSV